MSDLPPRPMWPAPDNGAANAGLSWASSREEAREELARDVAAMRRLGVLAWKRPDVGEIALGAPSPPATAPREAPRKETPDEERLRLHLERSRVTYAASGMRPKEPPP